MLHKRHSASASASNSNSSDGKVDLVYLRYRLRRKGAVTALTTDVNEFYKQFTPEKENLCLFGLENGSWAVQEPEEEVPTELPEPKLGLNLQRDEMDLQAWLSLVAAHTDSWLLSLAFLEGSKYLFTLDDRKKLFARINDLPTVLEVVRKLNFVRKRKNVKHGSKGSQRSSHDQGRSSEKPEESAQEEDPEAICGSCGEEDRDFFWIACDTCMKWYHGICVGITPVKAQQIPEYECSSCSSEKQKVLQV